MEIIDVVPDSEADFWEREYVQNFRERGFRLTNFSDGGEAPMRGKKHSPESNEKNRLAHIGKIVSAETREKLSLANSGERNRLFGKKLPVETREKISASRTGQKLTAETRVKISAGVRLSSVGKTPWNKGKLCPHISARQLGRKLSPESIAKRAATWKLNREKKKLI